MLVAMQETNLKRSDIIGEDNSRRWSVGKTPTQTSYLVPTSATINPHGAPRTPSQAELDFLQQQSQRLEDASPEEIIQWAVRQYFPWLTMATAFGPEGCVILAMLAKIEPRVYVFNLDTGYQFKETLELRDRIAERYGIEVVLAAAGTLGGGIRATPRRARLCTRLGQMLFRSEIDGAPPGGEGLFGLDERHSPRSEPPPGQGAYRGVGQKVRAGQDQPPGQLDLEGCLAADRR